MIRTIIPLKTPLYTSTDQLEITETSFPVPLFLAAFSSVPVLISQPLGTKICVLEKIV